MKRLYNSFKRQYLTLYLLLLLSFILSLFFDKAIVSYISSFQENWTNNIMVFIDYSGSALIIISLSTLLLLFYDKNKISYAWLSFAITSLSVFLLKIFVQRIRPFEEFGLSTLNFLIKDSYSTWNLSFPSFHAAIVFSALPFFKGKLRIYWFLLAFLISFSRLFFALHYLSDIIAGAVLGFSIGFIMLEIFNLKKRKTWQV